MSAVPMLVVTLALVARGRLVAADDTPARLSLGQAVALALAHHPSIAVSAAAERASRAQIGVARTAYIPRIELSAELTAGTGNVLRGALYPMVDTPMISGPPTGRSLSDAGLASAVGAAVGWDALRLVSDMVRVDVALAADGEARAVLAAQRLSVAASASDAFLVVLGRQGASRAAHATVDRARVLATAVDALVAQQLRPGADGARARAELALASTNLARALQAEAIGHAALARAIGAPDRALELDAALLLDSDGPDLRGTTATHPLLTEAHAAVQEAQARHRVALLAFLPRLELMAAIWARGSGLSSGSLPPSPARGLAPDTPNVVAGLVFTFPLQTIATSRAQANVASAFVQQQEAALSDLSQEIAMQMRVAEVTVASTRQVAKDARVELASAQEAETQARARYDAGLATLVEVAEADRLLALAETDAAVARIDVWRGLLLVARAAGDLTPFLDAVEAAR